MTQAAPDVAAFWNPPATRDTPEELEQMEARDASGRSSSACPPPGGARRPWDASGSRGAGRRPRARRRRRRSTATRSSRPKASLGTLATTPRGPRRLHDRRQPRTPIRRPRCRRSSIPAEQYGRIARMLAKNLPVTIEADIKNTYYPNPTMFNVVGEIPGTDKADEIVMLGAHFDSWHASTGATDNAAGSAAMMEAMRILKQSGVKLRRTVRIGLWTGEEQGLIGSRDYVAAHFAGRGAPPPPPAGGAETPGARARARRPQGPLQLKPDHAKFAGYFNIDNGTGAIRGVYLQGNQAVAPIFRAWMEPFRSLGMTTLTIRQHRRHGSPVVRRRRPARLPVHPGRRRIRHADAPHQPGQLRAAAAEDMRRTRRLRPRSRSSPPTATKSCRASRCRRPARGEADGEAGSRESS